MPIAFIKMKFITIKCGSLKLVGRINIRDSLSGESRLTAMIWETFSFNI